VLGDSPGAGGSSPSPVPDGAAHTARPCSGETHMPPLPPHKRFAALDTLELHRGDTAGSVLGGGTLRVPPDRQPRVEPERQRLGCSSQREHMLAEMMRPHLMQEGITISRVESASFFGGQLPTVAQNRGYGGCARKA
jgi:hypothetical protein